MLLTNDDVVFTRGNIGYCDLNLAISNAEVCGKRVVWESRIELASMSGRYSNE